jgi:hypothetical protein
MSQRRTLTFVGLVATAATVCWVSATPLTGIARASGAPGALIKVDLRTKVGVLLDEVPAGRLRDAAAADALGQDDAFWRDRAHNHVKLNYYRLVYRGLIYGDPTKGPLPLTPESTWDIQPIGRARRERIDGHDLVTRAYRFSSYIVTDANSPGQVEPNLAGVGGFWDEPLLLPADPELVLQRTGYACIDENSYPPFSVFEENVWYFYDQTCDVETPDSPICHVTVFPDTSCPDALKAHVGLVSATMRFTRVRYDAALAAAFRVGEITTRAGADLAVVTDGLRDERRVMYRYFTPDSCDIAEGVIPAPGWRRLLTFSAIVRNDGNGALHMGDPTDPNNPWAKSHVYELSPCHEHYHFTHYGTYDYNGSPGAKRAFCLIETNRYHNDEFTPLVAPHQVCTNQGIIPGWGDEYQFGLSGQWVDITDVDASSRHALVFDSNPDHFMCEGTPVTDSRGNLIFDPTEFRDEAGQVISRVRCKLAANWHDNNVGRVRVSAPAGSFVTEGCTRGQIGPLRDCGFTAKPPLETCRAGESVRLRCNVPDGAAVVRICEMSEKLGVGVACTVRDSIANVVIAPGSRNVSFTCPAVRDAAASETGGYSVYTAPITPSLEGGPVTCTVR